MSSDGSRSDVSPMNTTKQSRLLLAITSISALVSALAVFIAWPSSRIGVQKYTDLVVGEITLNDSYKSGDYLLSYLAVAVFFLCWFLLLAVIRRQLECTGAEELPDVAAVAASPLQLVYGCGAFTLGLLLVRRQAGMLEAALLGFVLLAAVVWLYGLFRRQDPQALLQNLIWVVLTTLFSLSSLLGLCALAAFMLPAVTFLLGTIQTLVPFAGLAIALVLLGCLKLPLASRARLTRWAQLCAPFLILVGFTRIYRQGDLITGNEVSFFTRFFALGISAAGVCMNGLLSRQSKDHAESVALERLILLPTVLSIAAFLAYKTPEYFPHDFFHVGESWIAWQQIVDFGKFPYAGYAIQRGFIDLLPGFLNVIFFDGTYASYNSAFSLWWLLGGALTSWLVCRVVGVGWGLVFSLCLAPIAIFKLWMFLPVLLILAHPRLLADPVRWLAIWFFSCLVHCLCHHSTGIAMTIGTIPLAVWYGVGALRSGELQSQWQNRRGFVVGILAVCILTLLALLPILLAWVAFIREQGAVNEIANGIVLGQRIVVPDWFRWKSPVLWEMFRNVGWLVGLITLWHMFVHERIVSAGGQNRWKITPSAVICVVGFVAAVGFIPYSMGRIDPKGLSRSGYIAQLLLGCLVPLSMVLTPQIRKKTWTYASVGMLLGIVVASEYTDYSLLPARAVAAIDVPPQAVRVRGARTGLPNLGDPFIPPEKLQDMLTVKRVMDAVLQQGETYLDLTNNMAFYPLLGKEVSSVYAGYYIATSQKIQQRMLKALAANPPALVWVGPARTFGSGSAALRSYRLYRWVMDNGYLPFEYNGAQFLVRKDRYPRVRGGDPAQAEMIHGMAAAFPDSDLRLLPVAWGGSYNLLARRFVTAPFTTTVAPMPPGYLAVPEVGQLVPSRHFSVGLKEPIAGILWDFLAFTITSQRTDNLPLKVKISWNGPGGRSDDDHAVTFLALKGAPLLVPLGTNPAWLLAPRIGSLEIEVADLGGGGDCSVGTPTLLSLRQ